MSAQILIKMKSKKVFGVVSALMVFGGAAGFWIAKRFQASMAEEADMMLIICSLVLFAWGAATALSLAEKTLAGVGAPLMLLIGLFIMVLAALSGALIFAILGGFMAVIKA